MSFKINNKGRSTGSLVKQKFCKLEGPFVQITRKILESPSWAALTLVDRKMLDRLLIEHMAHAGTENGNLKCTFSDFVRFGIRRASIADSIRRLEALGFIEIIERGKITKGEFKFPSIYRLTFVMGNIAATNEWNNVLSKATALSIVETVSTNKLQDIICRKKKKPDTESQPQPDTETLPLKPETRHKSVSPEPDTNPRPHYISWEDSRTNGEPMTASGRIHTAQSPAVMLGEVVSIKKILEKAHLKNNQRKSKDG